MRSLEGGRRGPTAVDVGNEKLIFFRKDYDCKDENFQLPKYPSKLYNIYND